MQLINYRQLANWVCYSAVETAKYSTQLVLLECMSQTKCGLHQNLQSNVAVPYSHALVGMSEVLSHELYCHPVEAEPHFTYRHTRSPQISIPASFPLQTDTSWSTKNVFTYIAAYVCECVWLHIFRLCVCVTGEKVMITTSSREDWELAATDL